MRDKIDRVQEAYRDRDWETPHTQHDCQILTYALLVLDLRYPLLL